ncbi:MAG: GFA family protein [Pseudomonadota bacterium]
MPSQEDALSGGCQCGAVRYQVEQVGRSGVCHCRMCQKAVGNIFAALVEVDWKHILWTRGEPAKWKSSDGVHRYFCSNCGTPLAYAHDGGIELTIGSFDKPDKVPPIHQTNASVRLSYFDQLPDLQKDHEAEYAEYQAGFRSFQHPDHDTDHWTAKERDTSATTNCRVTE